MSQPRSLMATDIPGFAARALVVTLLAVAILGSLVAGFSYATAGRDAAPVREAVRAAFAVGTLGIVDRRLNDRQVGAFQFNDCAILVMAANDHGTRVERALSPFGRLKAGADPTTISACAELQDIVVAGNEADYGYSPYHRYLHGGRALAAALVPELGVQGLRALLLAANELVLLSVLLLCLWRSRDGGARPQLALAVLSALLLTVSGVGYFGQSLSMGPADLMVHGMFALLVLGGPLALGRVAYLGIAAGSGVLVAYFEFLTGEIPLSVALLILLPAICLDSRAAMREAALRAVFGPTAFLATAAAMFALKYAITAQVFGPGVWGDIGGALATRTGLEGFSLIEVFERLAYRTHHFAFGSVGLGLAYLMVALAVFSVCIFSDLRASGEEASWRRWRALGFLGGAGSVLAWYVIFSSHSAVHSWFMIRPLALCCAASIAYLWLVVPLRRA